MLSACSSVQTSSVKDAAYSFTDAQAKAQYFDVDASKRIVVFGHTHGACILPFTNLKEQKTIYANSGTWIDDAQGYPTMTFVVITPPQSGSAIEIVNKRTLLSCKYGVVYLKKYLKISCQCTCIRCTIIA